MTEKVDKKAVSFALHLCHREHSVLSGICCQSLTLVAELRLLFFVRGGSGTETGEIQDFGANSWHCSNQCASLAVSLGGTGTEDFQQLQSWVNVTAKSLCTSAPEMVMQTPFKTTSGG